MSQRQRWAEASSAYRRRNPEAAARAVRAWKVKNPEAVKATRREHARRTYAENRRRVDAMKMGIGCVDCGYNQDPVALDFDHINGEKVGNIGNMLRFSWERIEAEIAKCEVVCANCHRVRTRDRKRMVA